MCHEQGNKLQIEILNFCLLSQLISIALSEISVSIRNAVNNRRHYIWINTKCKAIKSWLCCIWIVIEIKVFIRSLKSINVGQKKMICKNPDEVVLPSTGIANSYRWLLGYIVIDILLLIYWNVFYLINKNILLI